MQESSARSVSGETARALSEIATKHQGGAGVAALVRVIGLPAPHLGEAGPRVERPRGRVVLLDFEEHRLHAEPGEAAQMQIKQVAPQATAAVLRVDRDGEDFRLASGEPRQDETGMVAADARAV